MVQLFAFSTPNSIKVSIALEELGVPYELKPINIRHGEQRAPAFVGLNPNAKVPVLVDEENGNSFALTESAAILVYLAEKHGALLPHDAVARARVFEQLFFHASALGPAFGQAGYFQKLAAEKLPPAIDRFHTEAKRTLGLLELTLARHTYAAGEAYSIADIAHFGWIWRRAFAGVDFKDTPNVERWFGAMSARPAVIHAISRVEALVPAA
ncbi:glutathione S-transferase family protein [Undibacterium sp.]|uniref:glutathione S-transferase family protein n=1 Tax=Undibacterium sp. TaxID=1914977 RepID=UPI00374CFEE4